MSEETNVPEANESSWSSLKKTLVGTLATVITGAGAWVGTTLFNHGGDDKEEHKTEQVAPAPAAAPVINLNVDNSSKNSASSGGGTTTIIKEKVVEKPAEKKEEKKSETENSPW